ncbi:uncharacterized protein [Eleutherodactylus coqui]|uniref:uncharacterized protein n=1 Tax=Eleutherodactylus coqui TaxID=57060 RepID=UPI003462EB61
MEKAESPGNTETPGPAVDQDPDFVAGLDRHQKNFQTILLEIVKKYDHPFKNDTVFDFGRVTHTRTGKCIWKYKAFKPEHGTSEDEEHVSETDSDKARLAPCKKTSCGGKFQDLKIPCDKPETKSSQHSKKKLSTTSKTSEDFVDEEHVRGNFSFILCFVLAERQILWCLVSHAVAMTSCGRSSTQGLVVPPMNMMRERFYEADDSEETQCSTLHVALAMLSATTTGACLDGHK